MKAKEASDVLLTEWEASAWSQGTEIEWISEVGSVFAVIVATNFVEAKDRNRRVDALLRSLRTLIMGNFTNLEILSAEGAREAARHPHGKPWGSA